MDNQQPKEEEIYGKPLDLPEDDYRPPSPHQRRNFTKPILIILIILAVGGLGYGAWVVFNGENDTAEQSIIEPEEQPVEAPDPRLDGEDVTTEFQLETTRTSNPRMEVTHPDSWTLFDEGDAVWVESPGFSFTTNGGQTVTDGIFRIYFRQGAREVDSGYIGRAVATLPSDQITYSDPATGQREDSNLQFFGLDRTDHISFFMIAGNFNLSVGDTLGPDFGADGESYIIAGGYTSAELEDDLQFYAIPSQTFRDTNAYQQARDIITSLRLL